MLEHYKEYGGPVGVGFCATVGGGEAGAGGAVAARRRGGPGLAAG